MVMKTIRSFTNQAEAALCTSFLQANGFEAVLLDECSFRFEYAPLAIPIRLQVPEEQVVEALALLEGLREEWDEYPD